MEVKLFVFGIGYLAGDKQMGQFLDKSYSSREELEQELATYRAVMEKPAGREVFDEATQLTVEVYGILNSKREGVGSIDLVWADPDSYKKLVESTGREVGRPYQIPEGTIRLFGEHYLG